MAALLGVPRLLDAMRAHYGTLPSPDAARPPACGGGLLPAELRALRQGLLNTALSLLLHSAVPHHKATRIATDNIQVHMLASVQPAAFSTASATSQCYVVCVDVRCRSCSASLLA